MRVLGARGESRGELVLFVPRWIPDGLSPVGLPYKVYPVLSSLSSAGYEVVLCVEHLGDLEERGLRRRLADCAAAVVWCAELNPGAQLPGLTGFLELARELNPAAPRLVGGGFFPLLGPQGFDVAPLAQHLLCDSGIGSLAERLDELLGHTPRRSARTAPFEIHALRELDLAPFLRPESMLFGNEEPCLQIPTGYGCSKGCGFCFYERTRVRLLPARELVELVVELLQRYGVRQFLFGELDFFAARPRLRAVLRGLIAARAGVRWFALVSLPDVARLDEGDLDALAESGCHVLELGTEVGSAEELRRIGKTGSAEEALLQTRRLLERDIVPLHNIMLGFPGETRRELRATLDLVQRLRELGEAVRFNFRVYQATPQTRLGEEVLERLPAFPRNFEELTRYRGEFEQGRGMPWLAARQEEACRLLADYLLPLAYDDWMQTGHELRPARRLLRGVARLRCRTGFTRWPVDRELFRRVESRGLAGTFLP